MSQIETAEHSTVPTARAVRRIRVTRFAGPEAIEVVEGVEDEPGVGEVRVTVEASSATTSDSVIRRGLSPYLGDMEPPFTLGYDFVGVIDAVGSGTGAWQVGDRVIAITRWGSNADSLVLPVAALTRLSTTLDATLVEPMVMTGATAAAMVRQIGSVTAGDVVFVQGGSGGVGLLAVQAALMAGATVIASASPAKHDPLIAMGVDVLDYHDPELIGQVRDLAPAGVHLVIDGAGGANITQAAETLADNGVLVSYGFSPAGRPMGGRTPDIIASAGRMFGESIEAIAAVNASSRGLRALQFDITGLREQNPDGYAADVAWLLEHVEAGRLAPVVRAVRLEDAAEAHRALDAHEVTGRLVLDHRLGR